MDGNLEITLKRSSSRLLSCEDSTGDWFTLLSCPSVYWIFWFGIVLQSLGVKVLDSSLWCYWEMGEHLKSEAWWRGVRSLETWPGRNTGIPGPSYFSLIPSYHKASGAPFSHLDVLHHHRPKATGLSGHGLMPLKP